LADKPKFNRKSLLKFGSAGIVGAAVGSGTAAPSTAEAAHEAPGFASFVTRVKSVSSDGTLVLERDDGSTLEVRDPLPRERWQPGHEAVLIQRLEADGWRVDDIQRLYRPIEQETIRERVGGTLTTLSGTLRIKGSSKARADARGHVAVPLGEVQAGDVVAGLEYRNPDGSSTVALLGVRPRPR